MDVSSSSASPSAANFYEIPPEVLPEPLIYLSSLQAPVCKKNDVLRRFAEYLPGWIPQRLVALALGFDPGGIEHAQRHLGRPYLWATEFENVHALWKYEEPGLVVNGRKYGNSEIFFHSQKPAGHWDCDTSEEWNGKREKVMRLGVALKLEADFAAHHSSSNSNSSRDLSLLQLLQSTGHHPLLSLKKDDVWGFVPMHGGQNLLARIWEELRAGIVSHVESGQSSFQDFIASFCNDVQIDNERM